MPSTPILQEIHAELSLWQKIKLLAKIYWRYFIESVPVKFLVFFFGVQLVMIFKRKQVKVVAGEIMAEELGQKPIALPSGVAITTKSKTDDPVVNTLGSWTVKEYGIMDGFGREIYSNYHLDFTKGGKVIFVVDDKVTPITSRDEAYQWFKRVFNDPNPQIEYYENQNAMPYQAGNKPNPATYYTGSVPSSSHYVDLRWDTVANGEVNYKDFWK